jgi:transposase
MQIAVIGIDLGKNICSLAGIDGSGKVVVRRRVRRENVFKIVSQLKPVTVAMEACGGAHHLGRLLHDAGFEVRLMSPKYVRPYVKAQKNDDRDAEAIAEAATRPTMRFVELKSAEQLDMQVLHRARDRLVAERTALINQLRAVLMERGIVVPQGRRKLGQALAEILEGGDPALSERVCTLIKDMREEWCDLDRRICAFDNEFAARAREDEGARRLATIPGIGVLRLSPTRGFRRNWPRNSRRSACPVLSRVRVTARRSALQGRKVRLDPINVRDSNSLAVRAPYSRATSCLRTRPETDSAIVVPGSRARRNRRVRPANARDERESRRRRNHGTIPPYYRRCRSVSRSPYVAPELRRSAGRFVGSSTLPPAPIG